MKNQLIITPERFYNAMNFVLQELEKPLLEVWDDNPQTTKVWERRDGVYDKLAQQLGVERYRPKYLNLDAVFYHDTQGKEYSVLIVEHENFADSSESEMDKFIHCNAPLKVLVTYPGKSGKYAGAAMLEKYEAQISGAADVWGYDDSERQKIMVLFGMDDKGKYLWEYYLYGNGKFKPYPAK